MKNKNIKWWIGFSSCFVLFVVIGVFAYTRTSFLLKGVQIEASVAREGSSSLAIVEGRAQNATHITLNGREIFIDKDGSFREAIALIPGLSVVTIAATDKFDNNQEKKFQLVYEGGAGAVAMLNN